jgi:uncharacterized membrane protein
MGMPPTESLGTEGDRPAGAVSPATGEPIWRAAVRWVLVLLAVGLGVDACSGLPVTRGARSGFAWLGGVLAFGALYWAGESLGERLCSLDKQSDPLWKRTLFLISLLAFWGVVLVAFQVVFRIAT